MNAAPWQGWTGRESERGPEARLKGASPGGSGAKMGRWYDGRAREPRPTHRGRMSSIQPCHAGTPALRRRGRHRRRCLPCSGAVPCRALARPRPQPRAPDPAHPHSSAVQPLPHSPPSPLAPLGRRGIHSCRYRLCLRAHAPPW